MAALLAAGGDILAHMAALLTAGADALARRAAQKRVGEGSHILGPPVGDHIEAPDQSILLPLGKTRAKLVGRDQLILLDPVHSRGRHPAREAIIDGAGHGIDVRIGALTLGLVLLQRRETGLEHDGHGLAVGGGTGGAEVQELQLAFPGQDQIVGADVPMDQACPMDDRQVPQQRLQDGEQSLLIHTAPGSDHIVERVAIHILHDDISGAVALEIVPDAHHGIQGAHGSQGPGLLEEALQTALEGIPVAGGADDPGHGITAGAVAGEILLNGHPCLVLQVHGSISDAEAALTFGSAQLIDVSGLAAEQRAYGQLVGGRLPEGRFSAGRADLRSGMGHTVGTMIHRSLSFFASCHKYGGHPVASPGCALFRAPRREPREKCLFAVSIGPHREQRCAPTVAEKGGDPPRGVPGVGIVRV